jgi:hypothetical protein
MVIKMSETKKPSIIEQVGSGAGKFFSSIGGVIVAIAGIGILAYFVFQYINSGLQTAKDNYSYWIGEIVKETKEFTKENAAKGINGLTDDQKYIIYNIKGAEAKYWRDHLEEELAARKATGEVIRDAVMTATFAGIALGLVYMAPTIANKLKDLYDKFHTDETLDDALGTLDQIELSMNTVAWDLALEGNIGMAAGLQDSLSMYTAEYLPRLQAQYDLYQLTIANLVPNTFEYIAMSNMMSYVNFSIINSAIPAINAFWLPLPPLP